MTKTWMKILFLSTPVLTATVLAIASPSQAQNHGLPTASQRLAQADSSGPSEPATADDLNEATAIAQSFISYLAQTDFDAALQTYDSSVQATLTPSGLEQTWQDLIAQSGPLRTQIRATSQQLDDTAGSYLVIITGQFENGRRELFVIVNSEHEVIGLDAVEIE